MSMIQSDLLLGQEGGGGYQIERSIRLNSADSAHLSRNFTSAGNRKTWTWAAWVKRGSLGTTFNQLFGATNGGNDSTFAVLTFGSNGIADTLGFQGYSTVYLCTTQVFRDPSAWQHIVLSVDTTQATADNRVRLYVNGTQITIFTSRSNPSLNADLPINQSVAHTIGRDTIQSINFDGYLADVHFIDGQALTPTSFGEFDTNNVWQPKAYTGTFTGNSFWLKFADNSAATATTLGKDSSGLGNNWTPNNLSVTSGAGNDSLVDSPTNYGTDTGDGGEVRGNYCTWNPLFYKPETLSNGNLDYSAPSNPGVVRGTIAIPQTGKWYWEVTGNDRVMVGIEKTDAPVTASYPGYNTNGYSYAGADGRLWYNATSSAYGNTFGLGDVIGVAFDADNGRLFFSKNNTWQNSGNPSTGSNPAVSGLTGSWTPCIGRYNGSPTASVNFGQRPFAYTAPSGFKALCTANLPTPTITNGATAMDAVRYTGTGSTLTPTSTLGFSPDLVWIKSRSAATDNTLYDSVRGAQSRLESNNQDAQVTSDNGLTAFNSNGFTLGTLAQVNTNTATYAAWCWNESVSSGFDIVTYTGNGTAGTTVAHSLGVKPSLMIVKQRSAAGTNWTVYHTSTGATKFLTLQSTAAAALQTNKWNDTEPTSTVFTLGSGSDTNQNTQTYVGYLWAPVSGYSAFGSYSGNANADGPFIYLGFRPKWILLKRTESTGNWTIIDAAREGYNVDNDPLYPNLADAEGTTDLVDIVSNGFKLRSTDISVNGGTGTYAYACFAESPFALARAR